MPVRPSSYRNDAVYGRYGHYGSEEATTAGHRRMVVPETFALEGELVDLRSSLK
jgi:hypothetical protein